MSAGHVETVSEAPKLPVQSPAPPDSRVVQCSGLKRKIAVIVIVSELIYEEPESSLQAR